MKRYASALVAVLLVALTAAIASKAHARGAAADPPAPRIAAVQYGDLELTIEEDGELKALHSISVSSQIGGTITFMTPEGSHVHKGDVLFELDTENIEQRLRETQNELESAQKKLADTKDRIDAEAARLALDVDRSKTSLELAELALTEMQRLPLADDLTLAEKAYEETQLSRAEALREYTQTASLAEKGYATSLDLDQKKLALEKAELSLKRQGILLARAKRGAAPTDLEKAKLKVESAKLELQESESARDASISALNQQYSWEEASFSSVQKRLEGRKREFENHKTLAPAEGTVVYREYFRTDEKFAVGNNIWPGISVIDLPDTSTMMIRTFVPESAISHLELGKDARVRVDTLPGEEFPARVTWIDHWARDANQELSDADKKQEGLAGHQVFDIEAEITKQDERMKPGFKATIVIPIGNFTNVTYVDKRAVRMEGDETVVYLKNGEKRRVSTGEKSGQFIVIKNGLAAGEEALLQ